ncbi:Histone-binding protein RBBP4 [Gracilaria domingensis]|nr:Histone-binding protein RBBP4 [Gracilaria domingensis]
MVANAAPDAQKKRTLPVGSLNRNTRLKLWKEHDVPILYDWISSRPLVWPSAAVQWGAPIEDSRRDRTPNNHTFSNRAIYLSERTADATTDPNTLLQFEVRVIHELTNKPSEVARPWAEEPVITDRSDTNSSRDFVLRKRILHPGEVNRIRLISRDVVVTHTDNPHLFVWDFKRQPDRKPRDISPNVPDCTLVGHSSNAQYAIDVAASPGTEEDKWVVSGGSDCSVLLWRMDDYQSSGQKLNPFVRMTGSNGISRPVGHTEHIEDVSFCGKQRNVISSVGRDESLFLWDVRAPQSPTAYVYKAHRGHINSCDFGGLCENYIVTGGEDKNVRLWDTRKLKNAAGEPQPLRELRGHTQAITNLMWNRNVENVLASGALDGQVLIWRIGDDHVQRPADSPYYDMSPELLFKHIGHSTNDEDIWDLEWLPSSSDPWCIASLSETVGSGGSTLQVWRISDVIHRPTEEVAADLRRYSRGREL